MLSKSIYWKHNNGQDHIVTLQVFHWTSPGINGRDFRFITRCHFLHFENEVHFAHRLSFPNLYGSNPCPTTTSLSSSFYL